MKIFARITLLLLCSTGLFAQAPVPSARMPKVATGQEKNEVYFGFIEGFNDWGNSQFNNYQVGGTVSYTRTMNRHWGLFGMAEGSGNGDWDGKYFAFRGGARYAFLHGRFRPYLTASIGDAHYSGRAATRTPQGIRFLAHSWSGFTAGGGGGVLFRISEHFGARAEFGDYRVPFGIHRYDRDYWPEMTAGFTVHF